MDQTSWSEMGYNQCYYSGMVGKLYKFVHNRMEKDFGKDKYFSRVLELGAGDGQHFQFVRHNFDQYLMTDIRKTSESFNSDKISFRIVDATKLDILGNEKFDRLIATCLIVHLPNPLKVLEGWFDVLEPGGIMTIYVAPEPGILIRFARNFLFWPKAKKAGLKNPELLAYQEHITSFPFVKSSIKTLFPEKGQVLHYRFPTKFLSWNFSFFDIYHIHKKL